MPLDQRFRPRLVSPCSKDSFLSHYKDSSTFIKSKKIIMNKQYSQTEAFIWASQLYFSTGVVVYQVLLKRSIHCVCDNRVHVSTEGGGRMKVGSDL